MGDMSLSSGLEITPLSDKRSKGLGFEDFSMAVLKNPKINDKRVEPTIKNDEL